MADELNPEQVQTQDPALDVSQEELDASAMAMQLMVASMYSNQDAVLADLEQNAPNEDTKKDALAKRQALRAEQAEVGQRLPGEIKKYQDFLVAKAKETGVPVKVLAEAKNASELSMKVVEYRLTHPATTPAPVKQADPPKADESNTPPPPKPVDSGTSSGSNAGQEWRNLSGFGKIAYGLRQS